MALDFVDAKEAYNWNAAFVFLTMAVCQEALARAGLAMNGETGPRTACLIGSALNGADAFRTAMDNYLKRGPLKVSPYLLPNLCANLPSGKAGMLLGFTGPIFSPQGACASGNHAIGIGARMIRDGDCDFVLAGGVDTCLIPEIIHGFANMKATIKVSPRGPRLQPTRPRPPAPSASTGKGFVLSEGAGVVVLAAEEMLAAHGLDAAGRSDGGRLDLRCPSLHQAEPGDDHPGDPRGDRRCRARAGGHRLRQRPRHLHAEGRQGRDRLPAGGVRRRSWPRFPISSNKSQIGHTLGAAAAIEAALAIEGMQRG